MSFAFNTQFRMDGFRESPFSVRGGDGEKKNLSLERAGLRIDLKFEN